MHGAWRRGGLRAVAGVGCVIVAGCADARAPEATGPAAAPPASVSAQEQRAIDATLALWRDADPAKHPKGSCSGCHGADWFDLARIGSTDADLQRRAILDGATPSQAATLVEAVRAYRRRFALPAETPTDFRPFQPGGTPLPGATARDRDVAFGEQLVTLLPTLMGEAPIADLAQARRAHEEIADLVRGTNLAGANPRRLHLRTLPTGVVYPRWSADMGHVPGTLNDWVGDVARDPRPEFAEQWRQLQDAWLREPTTEHFWAMYGAVDRMLRPIDSSITTRRFFDAKFKSALIGQHLLRLERAGRLDDFARPGGIAFAALDQPALRTAAQLGTHAELPSALWDFADLARTTFGGRGTPGFTVENLAEALRAGRAPSFVAASVDPALRWRDEEQGIRLAWFWLGWTFEPSLLRSGASNSTRTGEYMKQSLLRAGMMLHKGFAEAARHVAVRTLDAARFDPRSGQVAPPPPWRHDNDLWAYGHWRGPSTRDVPAPEPTLARQRALYDRFLGNWFRMQAQLHLDAAARGPIPQVERVANEANHLRTFLAERHPATQAADLELLRRVYATAGLTLP